MNYILTFTIAGAAIGAFIAVMFQLAKKENEKLQQMISTTTVEQKNRLAASQPYFIEGKNNEWIQEGMIAEMKEKGNNVVLKVLWHNKIIQDNSYNNLSFADVTLSKDVATSHNLKINDFVKIHIAPEKINSVKIIF